jgi:hypothetical protein
MSREKRDAEFDIQIDALAARLRRQAGGADGMPWMTSRVTARRSSRKGA